MKKFFKLIPLILAVLFLASGLVSCSTERHSTAAAEIYFPMEGDGDYNGTVTNGSKTYWVSVWINAWDKINNNGTVERGSFFYTVFTAAEKTEANCLGSALCEENSSDRIEINGSCIYSDDDFHAICAAGDGITYTLELKLTNTNTGALETFTGTITRKAQ